MLGDDWFVSVGGCLFVWLVMRGFAVCLGDNDLLVRELWLI